MEFLRSKGEKTARHIISLMFTVVLVILPFIVVHANDSISNYKKSEENLTSEKDFSSVIKNNNPQINSSSKVFIDPETGKFIVPNYTQKLNLESNFSALSVQENDLAIKAAPGGGVMVELPESFYYFNSVKAGEDGELNINCTNDSHATNTPKK